MLEDLINELNNQIEGLANRVSALERASGNNTAQTSIPLYCQSSTFANSPTSPQVGQLHFFTDKTVPGGSAAGALGVWNGSVWVGPDGDSVDTY